jgi:serine/threonine protein kinase
MRSLAAYRLSLWTVTLSLEQSERRIFGNYRLIAKLAQGGMGEICVARLHGVAGFEKLVVIKRVLPHLAEDGKYIAMLQDEARIAARLSHQNICQVLELGQFEGEYYIAMEYLEGVVMTDLMRRMKLEKKVLDPRLVTEIVIQTCKGLDAAHELVDREGRPLNLVHRDISPSNLFITAGGLIKVLDFGIAKTPGKTSTTKTGAVKGKWAYMSPEQILRKPLDRRSDIFSLGVVLHEGLTGERLFRRPSEYETCQAITELDAPSVLEHRPDLPPALADVTARALDRDPDRRFATAQQMSKALYEVIAPLGGPASLSELAEFITECFKVELGELRRFIDEADIKDDAASDAAGPLPMAPDLFDHKTTGSRSRSVPRKQDEHTEDTRSVVIAGMPEQAQYLPPPPRPESRPDAHARPRSWLLFAALVTLTAAGAAFAYVKTRSGKSAMPLAMDAGVIQLVGDGGLIREGDDGGGALVPVHGALVDAAGSADVALSDAGTPDQARKPPPPKNYPAQHYSRAFSKKQTTLRACFQKHATTGIDAPQLRFDFRIDSRGRVTSASIDPDLGQAADLRKCLLGAARSMQFGPHAEPTEFSIPLSVKSINR